jgi:hypothetical protein
LTPAIQRALPSTLTSFRPALLTVRGSSRRSIGLAAHGELGTGAGVEHYADPNWRYGAGENQKILAHELFHVFQYQLDKLVNNGRTPSSQVRPSGPVWLDEGAPEMVGYRVAADRRLFPS